MVPKHNSETFNPVCPKSNIFIVISPGKYQVLVLDKILLNTRNYLRTKQEHGIFAYEPESFDKRQHNKPT